MKKISTTITMTCLFVFTIFATAQALTLSELIDRPLPSPHTVVSAFEENGQLIIDMKILNIPEDLPPVDIYLFLKKMHREEPEELMAADNPIADLLTDLGEDGEDEEPGSDVFFIHLSLFGTEASPDATPFFPGPHDIASWGVKDIPFPGFPVSPDVLPDIDMERYMLIFALVDENDEVISSSRDMIEFMHFGPGPKDCDFNGDGHVDEFEKEECENGPHHDPCDFNGDGHVDEFEKEECENDPHHDPCDFNGDGHVDEQEAKDCDNMHHDPCDFNGDGFVDEEEAKQCDNMHHDPCDFNGDGFVDEEEAKQCDDIHHDPCDFNKDGHVDEQEAKDCENMHHDPCDFNGDGHVDQHERDECDEINHDPCDFNGDGHVDPQEATQCDNMPHDPCDFNGDGHVDEQEAKDCENMDHDPCDFNGDGMIEGEDEENCANALPV